MFNVKLLDTSRSRLSNLRFIYEQANRENIEHTNISRLKANG